jgi:glycosyltransferase involved in cell wall biosynthesis
LPVRIGLVSTYPPIECGIATYTQYLTEALRQRGNEVFIFSEYGGKGDNVFSTYTSHGTDIAANVFLMATKMTPDILHIQHEFGLYGEPLGIQIIELILRCRVAGLPVITTFHTVHENPTEEEKVAIRVIMQESNAIIVHEDYHRDLLAEHFGDDDKIVVIPHGIREVAEVDGAREKLDVQGKKVVLLCGYLRESKRFDKVISVFPKVVEAVPNALLVIASKSRRADHPEYQRSLYKLIEESPVADNILVLHGQFPQATFDTIVSAADVVALPYEVGGQSGILAQCFAFRKPVVTSNLRAFRNWVEQSGGGLVADSDEDFEKHLVKILSDAKWCHSLSASISDFVSSTASWRNVAQTHMDVYEKRSWRPTPRSRYFS